MVSNHVVIYLKCLLQINGLKFDFSKFSERGSQSSFPRPLPCFFSGFALGSGLALTSQALRLGLHPRFLGASRPRFGLCRPQRLIGELNFCLSPQINSWIRPYHDGKIMDILTYMLHANLMIIIRSPHITIYIIRRSSPETYMSHVFFTGPTS